MKDRSSHKLIWLELGALLTLLALATLWMPTSRSMAQQDNRQLKREQTQPNGESERRVALVIGNGAYTKAEALPNPANDAANGGRLDGILVWVFLRTNLNAAAMVNLLATLEQNSTAVVGLFY